MKVRRGMSLIELLLSISLFSIVAMLSFVLLRRGATLWRQLVEAESASLELAKAASRLRGDVVRTSINLCSQTTVPASLAAGAKDGSALWFLSALDPATGEMATQPDGTLYWQRNVLYYLVVPANHQSLFGFDCQGGMGPNGFDDRCPHKMLIRKVIDSGPPTTPQGDPAVDQETLISDISPYLTRPAGYDLSGMGAEPGMQQVELIAVRLLWFEVTLKAPNRPQEIDIDLGAVALKEAQAHLALGSVPLSTGRYTKHRVLSLMPMN